VSDKTKIEWADASWNPVTGCTKISVGCTNCYAHVLAKRFPQLHGFRGGVQPCGDETEVEPMPFSTPQFHRDRLDAVRRWRKPRRVFVCSMGDLFHKDVTHDQWIEIMSAMRDAPQHTYMFLTKRPYGMLEFAETCVGRFAESMPSNWWFGVTAENQETANERIPILMDIPAAVRFVSVEPMLGPVNIFEPVTRARLSGVPMQFPDWCICGGETGHCARRLSPVWMVNLANQCQAAGVPFFFKKFGVAEKSIDGGHIGPEVERREFPQART